MIGVFGAGIGGLSVVKALIDRLPGCGVLFYGDTAMEPYDTKPIEAAVEHTGRGVDFLLSEGAALIVLAGGAATYPIDLSIVRSASFPVFETVTPAVKRAISVSPGGRFGVFGSRPAVQSGVLDEKLREARPDAKVYAEACPLLVPLVEAGWLKRPETRMIVKKSLLRLKTKRIDTLVLAGPHGAPLAALIQLKIGKRVRIVDPALAAAEAVAAYLEGNPEAVRPGLEGAEGRFFLTYLDARLESAAAVLLKRRVKLEKAARSARP